MQTIEINESVAASRRILFVAELAADTNETQRLDLGDISTSDTFTLTCAGFTTAAITYSATPATLAGNIDSALETAVTGADFTVTHVSGALFDVTCEGNLAATDVALMTINSPTTFTPGTVTQRQHGGIQGAPARGITWAASDISISKNGGTAVDSTGTVGEIGNGRYYYQAAAGEVDTEGFLSLALLREEYAVAFPTAQVVPSGATSTTLRSGTAQAGTAGTITLDASASEVANFYVPGLLYITSGTGSGQGPRFIYSYNGTTKVASVEPDFVVTPSSDSAFEVHLTPPLIVDLLRANHATVDTFGDVSTPADIGDEVVPRIIGDEIPFDGADVAAIQADTEDIQSRIPAALVSGRMSSDAVAVGGSTTAANKLVSHAAAVLQAVVDTGSTTTAVVLDAATGVNGGAPSASNDIYNGRVLVITSGAAAGQAQTITDYVGSTRTLTTGAFTTAPGNDDTAVIV